MNAIVHHILDEEDPYGIIARYKKLMPPGSYLLLTHFSNSSPEARGLEQVLRAAARSPGSSMAWTSSSPASSTCRTGTPTSRCRGRLTSPACCTSAPLRASRRTGMSEVATDAT
jgi:S-adenosyl methyltransferase